MSSPMLRLATAWDRHVGADRALLDELVRRHRERHRCYHTIEHVDAVVHHVTELARHIGTTDVDEGAVVAAALYHDAVYEPRSSSNERASARLARRDLQRAGWSRDRLHHVAAMIEGTATHLDPPDLATEILFDADLAILGASPPAYAQYVSAVRSEYAHVGDSDWSSGRAAVLAGFLDRPAIYATTSGSERWELQARTNLETELATLTG